MEVTFIAGKPSVKASIKATMASIADLMINFGCFVSARGAATAV